MDKEIKYIKDYLSLLGEKNTQIYQEISELKNHFDKLEERLTKIELIRK